MEHGRARPVAGVSADAVVDLEGRPALVLAFDPGVPAPALLNAGRLVWVGRGRAPEGVEAEQVSWDALRRSPPDPRIRSVGALDAIVSTLRGASPADVVAAIRHGVRRFHVYQAPGAVFQSNARGMLVLAVQRAVGRRLGSIRSVRRALEALLDVRLDPPWPTLRDTRRVPGDVLRRRRATGPARRSGSGPLRVAHYVGGLGPGGAERQLTYVAGAARAAGQDVRVYTAVPLEGAQAHYAAALRAARVEVTALPALRFARAARWGLEPGLARRLESHVAWPMLAALVDALLREPVDVLHCWLDVGNTVGALAGLIAGVPRIVISGRNVNPSHFPHLDLPWFRATYRWLSRCPDVVFINNSHVGARDYARWLGLRETRFVVIHNGVPLPPLPTPEERLAARRALAVPDDALLVVGVFRLSSEKRPFDFLEALARARARVPALRAVHVGTGVQEAAVRERAAALLGPTLTFAGRLPDPERWLRVADVALLTSEQEGCPNVSLEAQALGVPIVLTRAGGAPETVEDGASGFVVDVGAVDAIAERLALLAGDPARRRAMGERARAFVKERFSVDVMVARTLATYSASPKPS